MRYLIFSISFVLLFPACSRQAAKKTLTKAEANKAELESSVSKLLGTLENDYQDEHSRWTEQGNKKMTPQESQAHYKSHPAKEYGEKLIEFIDSYPDSAAAKKAWPIALKYGQGVSKQRAGEAVLNAAIAETDPSLSLKSFEHLMVYGMGEPQKKAMELMLAQARKESDPAASMKIIEKVATSRKGTVISDGVILMPGNAEVREQAFKQLRELAASKDVQSDTAVRCLGLQFQYASEEMKKEAFEELLKNHSSHEQTMAIVLNLGNQVNAESKAMIEQAIDSPDQNAQANAMVALSKFHSQKEREFLYYETAPPMHLMGLGKDRAAYLKSKIDPAEIGKVETYLSDFVESASDDTDAKVLALARKQLFEVQNLAAGKKALEISGQDLDGVEFKLSDYRGQVVVLDFWGDW